MLPELDHVKAIASAQFLLDVQIINLQESYGEALHELGQLVKLNREWQEATGYATPGEILDNRPYTPCSYL
jgi:hypothetical protein